MLVRLAKIVIKLTAMGLFLAYCGSSAHWSGWELAACVFGVIASMMCVARPANGYTLQLFSEIYFYTSLLTITLLVASVINVIMDTPLWAQDYRVSVYGLCAFLQTAVLLPELTNRIPRFSLRSLIVTVLALALAGTLLNNEIRRRDVLHETEENAIALIRKGGWFQYSNRRVGKVWIFESKMTPAEIQELSVLTEMTELDLPESGVIDNYVPLLIRMKTVKGLRGVCSHLSPAKYQELVAARPDLTIQGIGHEAPKFK